MTGDPTEEVVAELRRRGLAAPARLLLDAHRPLRPLLGHLATFLAPTLRPLLGGRTARLASIVEDDAAYDRLLAQLDGGDRG